MEIFQGLLIFFVLFIENNHILIPLEIFLVLLTLSITIDDDISNIIRNYRIQTILLLSVVFLTAIVKLVSESGGISLGTSIFLLEIFLLPLLLFWSIKYLLQRATLSQNIKWGEGKEKIKKGFPRDWKSFLSLFDFLKLDQQEVFQIQRIWRNSADKSNSQEEANGKVRTNSMRGKNREFLPRVPRDLFIFFAILLLSFIIAFYVFPPDGAHKNEKLEEQIGLAVSLSLHLAGLYNTVTKRDIISQVIGVLIMDHGLYLAVVKIVAVPVPAQYFVIALYAYTFITILILVLMIPQVIRSVKEEDEKQKDKKGQPEIGLDLIANTSPLAEEQD